MAFSYDYLNNLDSLVFDSPNEIIQSEKDVTDELNLWGNAQFTFDIKPGVGIFEEEKKMNAVNAIPQFEAPLDPVTYDTLVNYLDYELPRQQQKLEQRSLKRIQPRPLAPAIAPRQVLLPKPPTPAASPVVDAALLASLLSTPTVKKSPVQSPLPEKKRKVEESDDGIPDEDKRRRNTAASARFRVKKKLREQAMEQSVREMAEKSDKLLDRVSGLENEIKFLRSLLLEKVSSDKS
ncbi:hypothetical protein BDB01DRAFT_775607 [Pilobolus umbonatus]|nr:hypothetical protein BDB01DRAFT_775607 [Pilobolus umbonatus]